MPDYHYFIPVQQRGQEKNLEYIIACDSIEDAEDCFVDAKERLMDVNNWNKYSGISNVEFRLRDNHGKEPHRHARRGDHITIETQAEAQDGHSDHDWVAIEAIEYDDYPDLSIETFGMRLHPTADPAENGQSQYSLTDNASSTFIIQRRGKKLHAAYHGRNEPHDAIDGAANNQPWLGLSEGQWAALVSGIAEAGLVKR